MNTHVVIMAGGIGSRLWPVSTPSLPKQFIDLLGVGRTLIQLTVDRFRPVCPLEHIWVVTSEKYVDIVKKQLPGIPDENVLAEPQARNTAPCIAYACWKIEKRNPDANIVVASSDAIIMENDKFVSAIREALDFTQKGNNIVTIGITPTRPETGYGYIHSPGTVEGTLGKVSAFKEKPDLKTAQSYLSDGNYFWNAGIFVWNARTIKEQLGRFAPRIASVMDELAPALFTPDEDRELARLFPACDKISIDYAVMEKSDDIYVIPCNPGWSDLGSFGSLRMHIPSDSNGNSMVGEDIRLFDCENCVVHAGEAETVVVQGLSGYIVACKGNRLLVCKLSDEQRIKDFISSK